MHLNIFETDEWYFMIPNNSNQNKVNWLNKTF